MQHVACRKIDKEKAMFSEGTGCGVYEGVGACEKVWVPGGWVRVQG